MFAKFINSLRGQGFNTVNQIKSNLQQSGKSASGSLIASTRFVVDVSTSIISFKILAPKHWEYVDKGRRPGKFPPLNKIERWIRQKGIQTQGISRQQLAYLIGRKIAIDGIEPTNIYSDAINDFKRNFKIQRELSDDITNQIRNALKQQ